MRILVLHGFFGNSHKKVKLLERRGHVVCRPRLSSLSLSCAIRTAQKAHDAFQPDCIVGSSRGAAIAMRLETQAKLVLLAPAWKRFRVLPTPEATQNINVEIIHGYSDRVVDPGDSLELLRICQYARLCLVEDVHPMRGLPSLRAMLRAVHSPILVNLKD